MTKTDAVRAFREYLQNSINQPYKDYIATTKIYDADTKIAGNSECSIYIGSDGSSFKLYVYGPIDLCNSQALVRLNAELQSSKEKLKIKSFSANRKDPNGHIIDIICKDIKYAELDTDPDNAKKLFMKELLMSIIKAFKEEMKPGRSGGQRKRNSRNILEFPYNLVVFGAPGTGKSHYLDDKRGKKKKDVIGDSDSDESYFARCERVTFYPTYSYTQFVGTYKPVLDDKKEISYKFVPGPFLRLLSEALKNPESNYLLIIEEINRANAAAVFGDMFQLLDRMSDGLSEYGISLAEDIKKWLKDDAKVQPIAVGADDKDKEVAWNGDMLRLPKNFYIWATMNSADQGVFPLDTAFKRRWEFEYINVDGSGP